MREQIVEYKGVDLVFMIYDGVIRGYNKFLETTTNTHGGGGRIYTNRFTNRVYGKIKPVRSETKHKYITEFSVVEDNSKEVSIKLGNNDNAFREGQAVSVWVDGNGKQVYKIVNNNAGNVTYVNAIKDIIKANGYYFNQYLKANVLINVVWRLVQVGVLSLVVWFLLDISRGKDILATIVGFVIVIVPAILVYRVVKSIIRSTLIKGLKQKLKGHK